MTQDGVVCLKNVLDAREVKALREAVDAAVDAPSENGRRVANPGDPSFFFTDDNLWQRFPAVNEVAFESQIADLAAQLVGSDGMTLCFDNPLVKEGGNVAPWHEDAMSFSESTTARLAPATMAKAKAKAKAKAILTVHGTEAEIDEHLNGMPSGEGENGDIEL